MEKRTTENGMTNMWRRRCFRSRKLASYARGRKDLGVNTSPGFPGFVRFSLGKKPNSVQVVVMSGNTEPEKFAAYLAEEILRTIYGDDYQGCTVSPELIAGVIQKGLQQRGTQAGDLLELYEKVVEAVDLLSTPPDVTKVTDPDQLRALLSERLDGIHAVTAKTIQTTALLRKAASTEE